MYILYTVVISHGEYKVKAAASYFARQESHLSNCGRNVVAGICVAGVSRCPGWPCGDGTIDWQVRGSAGVCVRRSARCSPSTVGFPSRGHSFASCVYNSQGVS